MKGYKLPVIDEAEKARVAEWKEDLAEDRRKREYEAFLREQMAFEEAKRVRQRQGV